MEWSEFWSEYSNLPRIEKEAIRILIWSLIREMSMYEIRQKADQSDGDEGDDVQGICSNDLRIVNN